MTYKTLLRWQLASIALLASLFAYCVPSMIRRLVTGELHRASARHHSASLRQDSVHESVGSSKPLPLACVNVWHNWKEVLHLSGQWVLQFDVVFLKRIPNAVVGDLGWADPALACLHISENAGSFRLG